MSQSESVKILIISEEAESVKLITISLRGFFPGCRVDVAYSADEAHAWTLSQEWALILIDEQCLEGEYSSLTGQLKRRAPYAEIVLYGDRSDSASAIQALQADVDFFLSKKSPAFLTEILFFAKDAIETGRMRAARDHEHERYRRLVESVGDIVYELDAGGRFVTISPNITKLLGYSPDELIGLPYTALIPPDQEAEARFHLNERRSGARGTSRIELTLRRKPSQDNQSLTLTAEVNARGLYDILRRFLGTVGLIRDISQSKQQSTSIHQLRQQLQRTDGLLSLAQKVTLLSQQLYDPLASLLAQSQHLLATIRDARLGDQAEALASHAAETTKLGAQLEHTLRETQDKFLGYTINEILDVLLTSTTPPMVDSAGVLRKFASDLPHLVGDRERITTLIHSLINYAQAHLQTVGRPHRLILSTRAGGSGTISVDTPTLFPLDSPKEIEVELHESDMVWSAQSPVASHPSINLLESYQLVRELGGALDVSAPVEGPLRIILHLPVVFRTSLNVVPPPITSSTHLPAGGPEGKTDTTPSALTDVSGNRPQDRRRSSRIPTTLPAAITVGSTTWNGTISNLSVGGACITLPNDFPSIAPQDAYVVLKTVVGIIELQGQAQERPISLASGTPIAHLVISFDSPKQGESDVLASMVQAAQEETLAFSLEVLLAAGPQREPTALPSLVSHEQKDYDPREAVRVVLRLPVRLDIADPTGTTYRFEALTTNVSRGGACLQLNARPELLSGKATLHFTSSQTQKHPGTHEPAPPDSALPARIVWFAPDPTVSEEFRDQRTSPAIRAGLRFQDLVPYAEREVSRIVRQYLTSTSEAESISQQTSVVSISRECRNPRDQTIVIVDDHLRQSLAPNTPVVIIAPGYGQTALDAAPLSYYLAHHRLRILRYDHTNHVGLSDGELEQTTLRSMQADLLKVVEFVQHTWPTAPVIVIASDLTARVAIKMAAQFSPLDLLLLINPVVDVQAMLKTVHGHDLVTDHRYGLRHGIANLLGLIVNVDRFVGDIVAGHFADLASTISDLRLLRSPTSLLMIPSSPLESWPPADLPQAFLTALGTQISLATVPAPLIGQDLPLNEPHPQAFRQILGQIATAVVLPTVPAEITAQTRRMLARQELMEMERTRLRRNLSQFMREALRSAHLQQLPQLGNLHEYWKFMDDLYRLVSPLESNSMLLDVGVGHGDLIRATMVNQAYRSRQRGWSPMPPIHAIGAGRSQDSLTQARQSLDALHRELNSDFRGTLTGHPPMITDWMRADWAQGLPFKEDSIHRIVCNLSLPFDPSPLITIRELYRILHPQGRLVLSVFHPGTDLSALYRRYLNRTHQDEFASQAHIVLYHLGRLREAIRHGLVHTFDRPSMSSLLKRAGIRTSRISIGLEGQILFVVIEKNKSTS